MTCRATSRSARRKAHGWADASAGGSGCDRRALTRRPPRRGAPDRRAAPSSSGCGRPRRRVEVDPDRGGLDARQRRAALGPQAAEAAAPRRDGSSGSPKRGKRVTSRRVRRTTQAPCSPRPASRTSSKAASCSQRASASKRARPSGAASASVTSGVVCRVAYAAVMLSASPRASRHSTSSRSGPRSYFEPSPPMPRIRCWTPRLTSASHGAASMSSRRAPRALDLVRVAPDRLAVLAQDARPSRRTRRRRRRSATRARTGRRA